MEERREKLENDRAALAALVDLARLGRDLERGYPFRREEMRAVYQNGAGAVEPDAVVEWARLELAAVENSLDALDGGMPEPPLATVQVVLWEGCIEDVNATVPGVRVIIEEYDKNLEPEDEPRIVEVDDGPGSHAWMQDWTPHGDDAEREKVARGVRLAERMAEQCAAAERCTAPEDALTRAQREEAERHPNAHTS